MAEKKEEKKEKKAEEEKKKPKAEPKPAKEEKPKAGVSAPEAATPQKPEAKKEEAKPTGEKKEEADKEEKKIVKESVHTISLRKAFDHPRTSRVRYAAREVRRYIKKHTRKEAFIDPSVNEALWNKGIQSPPRRIKVKIQEEEKRATAVLA
ncbi:MAG: 60S ribosomal protein L31 [Candidatus Diapherotrites archaeon]|nr:60S ribosomal protein L31 [Candidatus Diapherotrites archaeon]